MKAKRLPHGLTGGHNDRMNPESDPLSPRIIDHRWPWQVACAILFAFAMGGLYWLQHGISQDFGVGFSLGGILGIVITLTAVGWRRGELR